MVKFTSKCTPRRPYHLQGLAGLSQKLNLPTSRSHFNSFFQTLINLLKYFCSVVCLFTWPSLRFMHAPAQVSFAYAHTRKLAADETWSTLPPPRVNALHIVD
ncbi:unnamed protein product [Ceratitis capitata]|uniref:(Mediterranean fruit fly) hypothetical protein n=1 Tax=Ceratitis capitata TaxID=7213 RepID=A0A811VH67_CERCA|nr:unnamed protein product [Ceratitis capitata]